MIANNWQAGVGSGESLNEALALVPQFEAAHSPERASLVFFIAAPLFLSRKGLRLPLGATFYRSRTI